MMIGKRLGADDARSAYQDAKRLMYTGLICSMVLSVLVVVLNRYYVLIFHVEDDVRQMTRYVLMAYALVAEYDFRRDFKERGKDNSSHVH